MGILQLSFYGPFVYDFTYDRASTLIFAPKCSGHQAGLFTAKTEYPLRGRPHYGNELRYVLSGPAFDNQYDQAEFCDSGNLILKVPSEGQDYEEANFCLQVPVPEFVYPLNPSPDVEVVEGGTPKGNLSRYATGLRFYYEADLTKLVTLSLCDCVVWESDFDQICNSDIYNGDVIVRYANTEPEDADHTDSTDCFSLIAALCGYPDWWLSYEDPQNPAVSNRFVRSGSDCGAPNMVVDGNGLRRRVENRIRRQNRRRFQTGA